MNKVQAMAEVGWLEGLLGVKSGVVLQIGNTDLGGHVYYHGGRLRRSIFMARLTIAFA